jgi:hypothetical protein
MEVYCPILTISAYDEPNRAVWRDTMCFLCCPRAKRYRLSQHGLRFFYLLQMDMVYKALKTSPIHAFPFPTQMWHQFSYNEAVIHNAHPLCQKTFPIVWQGAVAV